MEQYIFYNDVAEILEKEGIEVVFSKVGNYMTSLEMQGLSLTLLQVEDSWLTALTAPVDTPAW